MTDQAPPSPVQPPSRGRPACNKPAYDTCPFVMSPCRSRCADQYEYPAPAADVQVAPPRDEDAEIRAALVTNAVAYAREGEWQRAFADLCTACGMLSDASGQPVADALARLVAGEPRFSWQPPPAPAVPVEQAGRRELDVTTLPEWLALVEAVNDDGGTVANYRATVTGRAASLTRAVRALAAAPSPATEPDVCGSIGPRIQGEDERPRCGQELDHDELHRGFPGSGFEGVQWGAPLMRDDEFAASYRPPAAPAVSPEPERDES
jgi:hypothetical protein